MSNEKKQKSRIINITSIQFETEAIEAAKKGGITTLDAISTSFNRFKFFDDESAKDKVLTIFNVAYTVAGEIFVGQSTNPQLAIQEALNSRNTATEKTIVNSQASFTDDTQN